MVSKAYGALRGALIISLCIPAQMVAAQEVPSQPAEEIAESAVSVHNGPPSKHILPDSVSPFGIQTPNDEEIAQAVMPKLDGLVTPVDEENFDKYYYFHREDVGVATAFNDISECDGYARGLATGYRYQQAPYPYTYSMAGVAGAAIGNLMVAAIFGSAEKRRMRRINMRACMGFKGYQRFGLPKDLWEKFNFEEGLDGVPDGERRRLLMQQALVAVKAAPAGKVLEP